MPDDRRADIATRYEDDEAKLDAVDSSLKSFVSVDRKETVIEVA